MIEIADVFRRFAADYLSAHGASMLPSHRRAIEDILDCRTAALGGQVWRCETCNTEVFSYPFLRQPQLSQVPHRADTGVARTPAGGDAAGAVLPHHRHRAGRTARGAAGQSARRLWRADAGQRRRDHRTRPRSALRRRHRRGARRAAHLDPAVELAPARSLPGQRRRHLRGRHHLASGTPEVPGAHQGSRQAGARQVPGVAAAKVPRSRHPRRGVARPGSSMSPPGATANRPCSTTSPATSFASLSPTPGSSASTTKRSPSNTRNARPASVRTCRLSGDEFMRRFLQHVLPRGFHKVRYFGLWHPAQRHNAARVRQMLQLAGATQARSAAGPHRSAVRAARRGADAADRADDLSALSAGADDLHPQAHRRGRPWDHDPPHTPPPLLGLVAACLGTPRRSAVTNATNAPEPCPR